MDEKRKLFEANNWVKQGKSWIERGDLDKAERSFRKALEIIPDHEEANNLLEGVSELRRAKEIRIQRVRRKKQDRAVTFPVIPKSIRKSIQDTQYSRTTRDEIPPPKLDIVNGLRKIISEGIRNLADHEFLRAEKTFTEAIKDFPDSFLGWLYLGDTLVIQGRIDEARIAHQKAVSIEPSIEVSMDVHQTIFETGMTREIDETVDLTELTHRTMMPDDFIQATIQGEPYAEQLINKNLADIKLKMQSRPSDPELLISLGANLFIIGRKQEAKDAFVQSLLVDPSNSKTRRWFLISLSYELNRTQESKRPVPRPKDLGLMREAQSLRASLDHILTLPTISEERKETLVEGQKFLEAMSEGRLEDALEAAKKTSPKWTVFGFENQFKVIASLNALNRYKDAEEMCRRILRDFPDSIVILAYLTRAFWGQKKYDEAIKLAEKVLHLTPKVDSENDQMHVNTAKSRTSSIVGDIYFERKEFEDAAIAYRNATQYNPNWAGGWTQLGQTLLFLKQFEEAESILRKSIELNPLFDLSYYTLAAVLFELGRDEEAHQAGTRANQLRKQSGRFF